MKYLFFLASLVALSGCGGNNQPTPQEQQKVEEQIAKDQAAMDSMDKVIQDQINAVSDDSLMKLNH